MVSALGFFVLNLLQAAFLGAWSIGWICVSLVLSLGWRNGPLWIAHRIWGPGIIAASLCKVEVETRAELSPSAPYLFVMNHESMIDIAVAIVAIPRYLRFVAKKELRRVPFLGLYMWRTGMVFVDRQHPPSAYRSLEQAVARLRAGDCFIAFPEGTRSRDGRVLPFKRGPFATAVQAGVAVVPMAIAGSGHVLPRGGFSLRPGRIRMAIGAPIPTEGLTEDDVPEIMRLAYAAVIALHRELGGAGAEAEDRGHGLPSSRHRASTSSP